MTKGNDKYQYLSMLTGNEFYREYKRIQDDDSYCEYQYDSMPTIDPILLEHLDVFHFIANSYKQTGPQSLITVVELAVSEGIITMEQGESIWAMLVKLARAPVGEK